MNTQNKIQELLITNRLFYLRDQFSEEKRLQQAAKDFEIIKEYLLAYDQKSGPRVGDFLSIGNGEYARLTNHCGNAIQTGSPVDSYYLGRGTISYSGGLDPAIPIDFFQSHSHETTKEGRVWIFSDSWAGAHRGVYLTVPLRVYQLKRDEKTIEAISRIIERDRFPHDHPLHICDYGTPQFKSVLTEYYFYRNALGKSDHPLLKGCEIIRK